MNMEREGKFVTVIISVLLLCFMAASATLFIKQRIVQRQAIQNQLISVSAETMIGTHRDFLGDAKSPYTLVEFGDYQCPPCREADKQLPEMLRRYTGTLRLTFRNLPLPSIHPYAVSAADTAEAARSQGKFWQVHDDLFRNDLNDAFIGSIPAKHHLDSRLFRQAMHAEAETTMKADRELAQRLNLNSTPTFVLCRPDGKVIRLTSLSQLPDAINH